MDAFSRDEYNEIFEALIEKKVRLIRALDLEAERNGYALATSLYEKRILNVQSAICKIRRVLVV